MVRIPMILVIALLVGGCNSKSRVTEEDRVVLDHSVQIANLQRAKIELIASILTNDPAKAAALVKVIEELNADALANAEQLQKNWGTPKEPVIYSREAAAEARKRSSESHSVTFWASVGAAILTGGAAALALARKFGRFVPGFGPVFAALDSTITGIEEFMQKKKKEGDVDVVAELRDMLKSAHEDANLRPFVDKALAKAQTKLGIPVGEILPPAAIAKALEIPVAAAVPAAPAAPPAAPPA